AWPPPILYGEPFLASGDRPARSTVSKIPQRRLFKSVPRGTKSIAHPFVVLLKEWSPMVYAFCMEQLGYPRAERESGLNKLVDEWHAFTGAKRRPAGRE